MKVWVTGTEGFIGKNIIKALEARGDTVGRFSRTVDLRVSESVMRTFDFHISNSGIPDLIVHLADKDGDANWASANAFEQFLDNMRIHLNVLTAWKAHASSARFVGFSSAWAYPWHHGTLDEDRYWYGPMRDEIAHYGLTKKMLGMGIRAAWHQYGLFGTVLCLGSVYGPGDSSSHLIPTLINRMHESPDRLEMSGDGYEARSFIYIDDQVQGILQHMHLSEDLVNVGPPAMHSVREVVTCLAKVMGYGGQILFQGNADAGSEPANHDQRFLSHKIATRRTGWPGNHKFVSLEEGLTRTVRAYRADLDMKVHHG